MKHTGKRIFSVILCLCMIISLMPAALAAELGELVEKNEIAFDIVDGTTIEPEESASPRPQLLKIKTEDEIKIEEALLDVAVESDLEQQPIELIAGEAVQLVAVSEPENIDLNLRWSSANEDVFIVDDTGRATAVSAGTTAVLVETIDDENPLAACRDIVVTEAEVTDSTPDAEPAVNEAPATEEEPPEITPEPTEPPAVSRAEWIHGLVMQFSMTVDANNYPDNYYCDIDSAHPYYRDLMIAVEFGVIDLAAGLPFRPDEAATREFAAQTLNFCLGFRLDEGRSYTYSDFAACNYPDDDQIALDRGWFALIDSAFCPSFAITVDEQSKMLADAADILAGDKINTDHENTINYSEGVIAIPDGTMIEFDDEGNIRIVACPVIINEGDIFAFTIDGLPLAYKAVSVSMSHGVTVIVPTTEGAENAYAELDYEGTVDVDVSLFEPTGETNYYVGDMQVTESATIQGIHYDNGSKTLTASKTISLATGVKARINAQVSNLTVDLKANAATSDYAAVLHGNVKLTSNVNVDALAALEAPKSVDLGTVRILGGTVKITLSVEYSLSGELTLNWKGKIDTGFTYSRGSGFRVVKSFVKESFSFTTEVNIRSGLKLNAGINWLVVKADVWGKIGADMTVRVDAYDTGTPSKCTDLFGFMYASVGVKGKIVGIWSFNETKTIYDKSNSPIKVHYHYEDGSFVLSCSRGKGSGGSNQYSDYYTDPGSKNFSPGTWSGSYTGKDNEPVTVYTYSLDANNNATITGYSGYSSALVIPSKIDGYNVTAIGDKAFEKKSITTVVMPDTIMSIGAAAFSGCKSLNTVFFSNGLKYIYDKAFNGCSGLVELILPETLERISSGAFWGCTDLREINLPDSVTYIGEEAFGYTALSSIKMPDNLQSINGFTFYRCKNLANVELPSELRRLSSTAFVDCLSIERITIPKKLEEITDVKNTGFCNLPNLKEVTFEDGMTFIPDYIMQDCSKLKKIYFPSSLTQIGKFAFKGCGIEELDLPDSVMGINLNAFEGCTQLKKLTLPHNLKGMVSSFKDCTALENVVIPKTFNNCTEGWNCNSPFNGCTGLKTVIIEEGSLYLRRSVLRESGVRNVVIPNSVLSIGEYAFYGCINLTNIELSKNISTLGFRCFGLSGLKSIVLPKTLVSTDEPFWNCASLSSVTFEHGMKTVPENCMTACHGLTEAIIPDSVTTIGKKAFAECIKLSAVNISENISWLCDYAFKDAALTNVHIPDSVTKLGIGVFEGNASLKSVRLPNGMTDIPDEMFANCSGLVRIEMPDSLSTVGASAFRNCSSLKEVGWSKSIDILKESSFYNCDAIENVLIPSTVTQIDSRAFYDCDGLTDITIPDSVTSLGSYAFGDCNALVDVKLGTGITNIQTSTFVHCDELERVNIPRCVTSIASNAFKDCVKFKEIHIPRSVTSIDSSAFSYPSNLTIYGVSGTYAETFAKENNIKFVDSQIHATSAELSTRDLRIPKGSRQRLYLTVTPADFTDEVIWKASKPDIAYVDNTGLVSARDVGISTIKVTVGSVTVSCKVTVYQPVTSISLNQTSLTLEAAQTCKLVAYVNPSNAENRDVIWSSSDNSVALVDENGIVTAKTKGSAVITATAADGSGVKTSCTVTVPNTAYFVAEASQLESPHDYPNNCSDIWVYTHTGAGSLTVTFDKRTELEEDFDFLYIYDGSGNEIGKYTGTELAGASVMVPGDSVKLKLVSDNAGSAWGFKVTDVKSSQSEYVVSYDANGGSGAPEKQTKIHDKPLTLSSIKPTRSGYKFLGWATSKSATTAEYLPGGSYTANAAVTLYAVWKEDTRIPGDTNGDGVVNVFDLVRLKKYLTGGDVEIGMLNADVTGDGKIDVFDLLRLKKYLAGMAVELQ